MNLESLEARHGNLLRILRDSLKKLENPKNASKRSLLQWKVERVTSEVRMIYYQLQRAKDVPVDSMREGWETENVTADTIEGVKEQINLLSK